MRKRRHTVVKATSPLSAELVGSGSGDGAEMLGPRICHSTQEDSTAAAEDPHA